MCFLSIDGCFHIEKFLFSDSVIPFLSLFSFDGLLFFHDEPLEKIHGVKRSIDLFLS